MQSLAERAGIELPKQGDDRSAAAEGGPGAQSCWRLTRQRQSIFNMLLRSRRDSMRWIIYQAGADAPDHAAFWTGVFGKYSDDLYRYLKKQGYPDDLLKDSGLIIFDEKRGGYDRFLEPGHVSDHGCEQPGDWPSADV